MEIEGDGGGDRYKPPVGDKLPMRLMKTPFQMEVLESAYAVGTHPSESKRAELSAKLGLSDRQVQMWFCNRRLKARKLASGHKPRKKDRLLLLLPQDEKMTASGLGSGPSSSSSMGGLSGEPSMAFARAAPTSPGFGAEASMARRSYELPMLPLSLAPPLAPPLHSLSDHIASVEGRLGGPIREDGPMLGVEFGPLPAAAFGVPIAITEQQKQPAGLNDGRIFEGHEAESNKTPTCLPIMEHCFMPSSSIRKGNLAVGGALVVHPQATARTLYEYQFLPEQPSIREEAFEVVTSANLFETSIDNSNMRVSSLPTGGQFRHQNEHVAPSPSSAFQGQMSSASLLSQPGRKQTFSSGNNSFMNTATDARFGINAVIGLENPFLSSDGRIFQDEDASQMESKCKHMLSEEARIEKEVEAHEKWIRKEFKKQYIMRRKGEEQMQREIERHDCEGKEEERLMHEKQQEEARFQLGQRREKKCRKKFLQKETLRAEKMRQKEEVRREVSARFKAANERASARRIARVFTKLIEDERLELMELAASSKGLSSITSLGSDTLEQLDSFRDMLDTFPPKSVWLKRPFAIQPWTDSEQNIGNALMVWRFLISFADVLELWPFTLDEFVQSFHDYDSRLLDEVHVALLKSIIKNMEDVARTPVALGANHNPAANPEGGHSQIVEGAYAWGFDIRNWHHHLNFLTWPEILRQVALSAGFGPQLKKRTAERDYFHDENEGNDVVSTLRTGEAAENAVALMQEKGLCHLRRSRYRLTPGTVKYAAFHVLSLEGSKGLTISEVAFKIQKSGLRGLMTSKTLEESIAAVLSRDAYFFKRTDSSTYCVRPTFRKDPADADAILSAAREKIQVFEIGLSDSEEAEKDTKDADDAKRDEVSDYNSANYPEVDDEGTEAQSIKKILCSNKSKDAKTSTYLEDEKCYAICDEVGVSPRSELRNVDKVFSSLPSECRKDVSISASHNDQSLDVGINFLEACNTGPEDIGEPWVQGLTEREYSDLSVEERLNALVALIGVAIEGNLVRTVLEEHLDAANALKKQMWAEAQLDKRCSKKESSNKTKYSSFMGMKAQATMINAAAEERTPLLSSDGKNNGGNPNSVNNKQFLNPHNQRNTSKMSSEKNYLGQEFRNPDSYPLQQCGYAAEKSRSQLKSYIGQKAEEIYVYRSLPLGQDRRHNRYWLFSTSACPNDPGSGRIFFESNDGSWRLIDSEEAFDALLAVLDTRGIRESHLHSMLQKIETTFRESIRRNKNCTNSVSPAGGFGETVVSEVAPSPDCRMGLDTPSSNFCDLTSDKLEHSASFRIELGRNEIEKNSALKRCKDFVKWIWKECFNPFMLHATKYGSKRCSELLETCSFCYQSYLYKEKHCPSCHKTYKNFDNPEIYFPDHVRWCEQKRKIYPNRKIHVSDSSLPIRIRLLKAQLAVIEVSVPAEALQPFWTEDYRKSWGLKLHSSSSADKLLQILTLLESAIKRDCLSSNFETTNELLKSSTTGYGVDSAAVLSGSVSVLPRVPDTTAAVALRLLKLDASISYILHQKDKSLEEKEDGEFMKLYAVVKNTQELEPTETPKQVDYQKEGNLLDPASGCSTPRRGRRGRGTRGRGRGSRGRGRGSRGRGSRGRGSRGRGGSGCSHSGRGPRGRRRSTRLKLKEENISYCEKTTRKRTRRGSTHGRGLRQGCLPVKPWQTQFGTFNDVDSIAIEDGVEQSPRSLGGNKWGVEENRRVYVEDSSTESESDENDQDSDYKCDDQATDSSSDYDVRKPIGLMDDESEDEDDDMDDDGHEDMDIDADEDEEETEEEHGEWSEDEEENGTENKEESSFSSEYSD